MTPEQVRQILTAICDQHDGENPTPEHERPNIEILHGPAESYTVIDATFPAWDISDDGILTARGQRITRWITCDSIHCIGI